MTQYILAIDGTDPDNFAALWALAHMYPGQTYHVLLTGRPTAAKMAPRHHSIPDAEREVQEVNAGRLYELARRLDVDVVVYDGGVAPRTLIPHHTHLAEASFPNKGIRTPLAPTHSLADFILELDHEEWVAVLGGPATGLVRLASCHPEAACRITHVHAMLGALDVELTPLAGRESSKALKQFNLAADPLSARALLEWECPVFLYPSDVTRVPAIGYTLGDLQRVLDPPSSPAAELLFRLYSVWNQVVVAPRHEPLYLHDLAPVFGTNTAWRDAIYNGKAFQSASVPTSPGSHADWGSLQLHGVKTVRRAGSRKRWVATGLRAEGHPYRDKVSEVLSY